MRSTKDMCSLTTTLKCQDTKHQLMLKSCLETYKERFMSKRAEASKSYC